MGTNFKMEDNDTCLWEMQDLFTQASELGP